MNKKITTIDENSSNVNQDKQTKQKSNAQKALPWLIVAIVSLLIILTCVLIAYYQVYSTHKQNANTLEGVYASSYYSMVDNVNNLAVDVAKYSTLTTDDAKTRTLQDMMVDCNYILGGLSVLPIEEENVASATRFFNQINGVCEVYSMALKQGKGLTQEQELIFDKIGIVLGEIKNNFNTQADGMYDTGFNFIDASIFDKSGMNELTTSMGDLTNIEYPAMIFDGPFSTALETKQVKGLGEKEYTQSETENYLKNTVFKNRDAKIEYDKQTDGDLATYDYEISIKNKTYLAQVSKKGSLLLTMSSYVEGADAIIGTDYAKELASTFANNIGFKDMQAVWAETKENVAYINLAPIVNDVIMYPDLVKVKVDLTSQDIIGFEAVNYALNHIDRNVEFVVDNATAEQVLGFDYEILKLSKAVIRLDSGKEIPCYEYVLDRIDGVYYYYINAQDGQIAKVMKLVTIKNVDKLI